MFASYRKIRYTDINHIRVTKTIDTGRMILSAVSLSVKRDIAEYIARYPSKNGAGRRLRIPSIIDISKKSALFPNASAKIMLASGPASDMQSSSV